MARKFVTNIDLNKNEIQNARIQNLASAPASPVAGQMYYDTTIPGFRYWNGAAWVNVATDSLLLQGQNGAYYLSRANHTGTQLAATISDFDTQVRTSRLDQMAAPTAAVSLNSQKITNLATPTAATDAATKAYVDGVATGLDVKASVRAASVANVSGTYNATAGTSARGQLTTMPNTVDGVTLAAGDRVLLKNQTAGAQNGIWVVSTLGTGANGVWDRAADFDQDAEVTAGAFVFIEEGTANDNTGWTLTTNNPITVGGASGTIQVWAQFSGAGAYTAGAGLTQTGTTFDVVAGATPGSGGPGGGLVVHADDVVIDTNVVVRKYATSIGDGAALAYTVTHNLGTQDVNVQVHRVASPFDIVEADMEAASTNTVIIRFATAPASNEYRVIVHG